MINFEGIKIRKETRRDRFVAAGMAVKICVKKTKKIENIENIMNETLTANPS